VARKPQGKGKQRPNCGRVGEPIVGGREPDLIANEGVERPLRIGQETVHDAPGADGREAPRSVDFHENLPFLSGVWRSCFRSSSI